MRTGDVLGPYSLVAEIGTGGMGVVWSADGPDGRVALKIVHPHLAGRAEFLDRFRREGEIGMRVRHENVVATLAVGSAPADGWTAHFLVMELVAGRTLRALLADLGCRETVREDGLVRPGSQGVPEELCRHIGREIAKGLAAIHAAGAIHRDLKPENVIITPDNVVKLMDLGVVRLTTEDTRLSEPGAFVGSFHYAAPEQYATRGAALDHRADLFALGLVLYELSTGKHPFDDGDLQRMLQRLLNEKARRVSELNPQISVFFEETVNQLLQKDRERRFATASDLLHVLDAGEDSTWWKSRATAIRAETRRPLRRIRIARETEIYGRDAELTILRDRFGLASEGSAQVVLLEGEAGIGKSRLLDEFTAELQRSGRDVDVLYGGYPPGGAATAYAAFVAACRDHLGGEALGESLAALLPQTPLLVAAFAALLSGDASPPGAEALTKDSIQTVFVHLVRSAAAQRPLVWIVDDLDLAPDEGRALFAAMAVALPGHRVMLVATTRPGVAERWVADLERRGPTTRIPLGRLGPKDLSRLLVDAFRSERLAEELAFKIAAKSDGNPYFVFEILRGLREGRFIERKDDGTWASTRAIREIKIPSSVEELVKARIDALSAEERNLLDVAACCGFEFDPLLAGAAIGLSRMAALQRLAWIEKSHRIVRSCGRRYVFDHHQVPEVLYGALTELLREEYHAAIGEALAARSDVGGAASAEIALHFLKARRADRAGPFVSPALGHLMATEAHEGAITIATLLLAAPGAAQGRERLDLLLLLAERLAILGRRSAERAAIDEAVAIADEDGDATLRGRTRCALGWHLALGGRPRDAMVMLEEGIALAVAAGDARVEQTGRGHLGSSLWALGRFDEARAETERQIALAQAAGDVRAEAFASGNLGLIEYGFGRYEAALACHGRQLEWARRAGDRRAASIALGNIGIVNTSLGNWDAAREHIEAQLAIAQSIGDRRSEAIATGNLGNVCYAQGRWSDARMAMERGVALAREVSDSGTEATALVNLGPLVAELGDAERADDALDAALSVARASGARYQEGYALFEQGELADAIGDRPRAASLHERALALRREMGHRDGIAESALALARIRAAAGEIAAARAHLDEAAALSAELGLANFATLAAVYRAALPGGDAAAALASFAANESRMMLRERMEARWLLARVTGDASHAAEARRLLDQLVANAPPECREAMVRDVPLHRAVAESGDAPEGARRPPSAR
jgi:serine/threonine protein kinase/tetratricopeptide (TPR) repeat protein